MEIKRIKSNARMSQAVIHNDVVYLAGQIPADKIGASFSERTLNTLQRIEKELEEVGSHKGKILSATVYLEDLNDFEAMNTVWESWLPQGAAPARATVRAGLGPGFGIEISIIAALP